MNKKVLTVFLYLFLAAVFFAFSQDAAQNAAQEAADEEQPASEDFLIIPILETIFLKQVNWHPGWPDFMPPDSFYLNGEGQPSVIELSDDQDTFVLRRDGQGRLLEFPFFYSGGYAKTQVVYNDAGFPLNMTITIVTFAPPDDGSDSEDGSQESAQSQDAQSDDAQEQDILFITFPANFMPYSEFSPGGSFPPLTVNYGESAFFVYLFETPSFLTETWYDSDGNMLLYSRVNTIVDNISWRIRDIAVHDENGMRTKYYSYDSSGSITQILLEDILFSAVYRDSMPVYWKWFDNNYNLQWDTQNNLTIIKMTDENDEFIIEYRYSYEYDSSGNWKTRREAAYMMQFDILAVQMSYSRGTWIRNITE